uniref:Uncharacterized protein n=1 Tax=Oryza brachyantha TaxID=4533 RepID=J3KWH3_ORYBR
MRHLLKGKIVGWMIDNCIRRYEQMNSSIKVSGYGTLLTLFAYKTMCINSVMLLFGAQEVGWTLKRLDFVNHKTAFC